MMYKSNNTEEDAVLEDSRSLLNRPENMTCPAETTSFWAEPVYSGWLASVLPKSIRTVSENQIEMIVTELNITLWHFLISNIKFF